MAPLLALLLVVFDLAACSAFEPPTVAEIRRDSAELRAATRNLQGTIRVFRADVVNPAALEKLPSEIGLPLVLSGTLWRGGGRFRADYKQQPTQNVPREIVCSVAVDGGTIYELTSSDLPGSGKLDVLGPGTPESAAAATFIKTTFDDPLDSLWSDGSIAYADILQRPEAKIAPSQMFPGGYALLDSTDEFKDRFEFGAASPHPLAYYDVSAGQGNTRLRSEQRVFSKNVGGKWLPSRVAGVNRAGRGGFTRIVMLDLKPLEANSPIAGPITEQSFRNLGVEYRVYNFRKSQKETFGQQYDPKVDAEAAANAAKVHSWRTTML